MSISSKAHMLEVREQNSHVNYQGKEETYMAEAVGLESETVEAAGTETDGPGGPNTQQDGNFDGNY